MLYDKMYKDQLFWDNAYELTVTDFVRRMRQEMMERMERREIVYPPAGKDLKTVGIGVLISVGAAAAAGGIAFAVSGSGIGGFCLGFILFFILMCFVVVFVMFQRLIKRPQKMTQEVNATCMGYSLTGGNNNGGFSITPVFKYFYGGREYLAYDGNYQNHSWKKMPPIDSELTIRIDPEDPAELMWSEGNNKKMFIFCTGVTIAVLAGAVAMLFLIINTPDLWSTGIFF